MRVKQSLVAQPLFVPCAFAATLPASLSPPLIMPLSFLAAVELQLISSTSAPSSFSLWHAGSLRTLSDLSSPFAADLSVQSQLAQRGESKEALNGVSMQQRERTG